MTSYVAQYLVRAYPTFKIIAGDAVVEYNGENSLDAFVNFIEEFQKRGLAEVEEAVTDAATGPVVWSKAWFASPQPSPLARKATKDRCFPSSNENACMPKHMTYIPGSSGVLQEISVQVCSTSTWIVHCRGWGLRLLFWGDAPSSKTEYDQTRISHAARPYDGAAACFLQRLHDCLTNGEQTASALRSTGPLRLTARFSFCRYYAGCSLLCAKRTSWTESPFGPCRLVVLNLSQCSNSCTSEPS